MRIGSRRRRRPTGLGTCDPPGCHPALWRPTSTMSCTTRPSLGRYPCLAARLESTARLRTFIDDRGFDITAYRALWSCCDRRQEWNPSPVRAHTSSGEGVPLAPAMNVLPLRHCLPTSDTRHKFFFSFLVILWPFASDWREAPEPMSPHPAPLISLPVALAEEEPRRIAGKQYQWQERSK